MEKQQKQKAGLVDIHRHLDGSLRRETALELASRYGIHVPQPLEFTVGMGLQEALARFQFTLALLQNPREVSRVAAEMCVDAIVEGVTTLEIRFAPQMHRLASIADIVDAALFGIADRASLILCGLYGESPAIFEQLVEVGAQRTGVVGLDLAGAPRQSHRYGMEDYAEAFREAARQGLGRTVHAGEGRPAAEIGVACEKLGAQRIGHALSILDDPGITALARENGIVLEANITSNVQTGVIATVAEHPLPRWLDAGLKAAVCTDNTLFSAVTAPEELARAATLPGMTQAKINKVVSFGHQAAFCRG